MIGDQDLRHPLSDHAIEVIDRCKNVHRLPRTEDLPSYMAAMDIFTLPSHREGFGNTIIEASAMELPVVATDIIGCRDALVEGKTGLLVKFRDIGSLKEILAKLVDDPTLRYRMGQNGRQWVEENFNRKVVMPRLVKVFEQILESAK